MLTYFYGNIFNSLKRLLLFFNFKNHGVRCKLQRKYLVFCEIVFIMLLVMSILGSIVIFPLITSLTGTPLEKEVVLPQWTVMVYCDADNNLDSYGVDDVNEMETGYSAGTSVNVICMIDRYYTGAKTYQIGHDESPSTITSTILVTGFPSEPNMGAKLTLKNFITYCFNNYPAQKYVLDLWDHGGGVFGICWDDSSSGDRLSFDEVDEAISEACAAAGKKINILSMDACLMGMLEINYECREYVDYIVASEETIPGDGYPYNTMIQSLCASPMQSAATFANDMVNDYYDSYSSSYDLTLSAVDVTTTSINDLMGAFTLFTAALIDQINNHGTRSALISARVATQIFYYDIFVDLYDFANEAKLRISDTEFDHICDILKNNISAAVINSKQRNNPQAYGISIYFPDTASDYDSGYASIIDLGQETDWDLFLTAFYYGPTFQLSLQSETYDDDPAIDAGNDNDGVADQGETINVTLPIKNTGSELATNVNGTLTCTDGNITILVGFRDYGTITAGSTIPLDFQFNVSQTAPNNLVVTFELQVNATFSAPYSKVFDFDLVINASTGIVGGDSFDTAVLIVSGTYDSTMPGPDPTDSSEWYKFSVSSGDQIQISIDSADPGTDFDAYLYDPYGSIKAYAIGTSYPDTCSHTATTTGFYRLRIKPYSGSGAYTFTLTLPSSPSPTTEDGFSFDTAITLLQDTNTITVTLPSAGPDGKMYYRIYVNLNEHIVARLEGDSNQHDFDLYLYDQNQDYIGASTSYSYPEMVSGYPSDPGMGYLYIVIVPYSGNGSVQLTVEIRGLDGGIAPESIIALALMIALVVVAGIFLYKKKRSIPSFFSFFANNI